MAGYCSRHRFRVPHPQAARRGALISTGLHEISDATAPRGAFGRTLLGIANALRLTPNALTLLGFGGICVVAILILEHQWVIAGLLYVAFSVGDSLDGSLARAQGRASQFGAFLDSTLDRLAEGVILGALGVIFAERGQQWIVGACFIALTASFLVSYTRARSEGLGIDTNKGGLMGRPERLVLTGGGIFMGSLGSVLAAVIVVLAALSLMTMVHRIWHIYRALQPAPASAINQGSTKP